MAWPRSQFWIATLLTFCIGAIRSASAQALNDGYLFATINDPQANGLTLPYGISGSTIVGYYLGSGGGAQGFEYNGSSFTTLDVPGSYSTALIGVSPTSIVGSFGASSGATSGFLYNGSSFITLDSPGSVGTIATGVSGSTVVGYYTSGSPATSLAQHGFIYNNSAYTTLNDPLAGAGNINYTQYTHANGISGNLIVGDYIGTANPLSHGFIYNGSTYTTLDDPLGLSGYGTYVTGVDGNLIVGYYGVGIPQTASAPSSDDNHGFIYNMSNATFTTVDDPLAANMSVPGTNQEGTYINAISNGVIVGYYVDANGDPNGFIATPVVPEPASASLLSAGGLLLLRHRRHPRRRP
jgi:hypothetical protein